MIFDGWDIFREISDFDVKENVGSVALSHLIQAGGVLLVLEKPVVSARYNFKQRPLLSRSQQAGEQGFLLNSCTARRTEPMPGFAYFNKLQRGYIFLLIFVWRLLLKLGNVVPSGSLSDSDRPFRDSGHNLEKLAALARLVLGVLFIILKPLRSEKEMLMGCRLCLQASFAGGVFVLDTGSGGVLADLKYAT